MIDILRQHYFPRSETTSRDRKISGCHIKGYACLMGENKKIYDGVEAETRKSKASIQIIQVLFAALLKMSLSFSC